MAGSSLPTDPGRFGCFISSLGCRAMVTHEHLCMQHHVSSDMGEFAYQRDPTQKLSPEVPSNEAFYSLTMLKANIHCPH